MNPAAIPRWLPLAPALLSAAAAGWSCSAGTGSAALAALIVGLGGAALSLFAPTRPLDQQPAVLAARRTEAERRRTRLEAAQDLQRGVFEVSAELVGCVDEADARTRFGAALRRWWACTSADLLVWERGTWRSLGGPGSGEPPLLDRPVQLPEEAHGDLVLDLSPAVEGQAALVLRGAVPQPSLDGVSVENRRTMADVLRGQLALSLRRVVLYGELNALARTDPLTTAHRRWYGEARLKELADSGEVVAVAMVDIDHFKRVNDQHGHAAGDLVLAAVGRSLGGRLRTGDLVCRYGGEEFLVLLPETGPDGALLVAERLRAAIAAIADLPSPVTVSIGLASILQDEDAAALVARADAALYQAKHAGRNRVAVADDAGAGALLRTTSRQARRQPGTGAFARTTGIQATQPRPGSG